MSDYQDEIYITLDMDWVSDEILEFTIDVLEELEVAATFFVTHHTVLLDRIRQNTHFELGIHPNFNSLLDGSAGAGQPNAHAIVQQVLEIVPEAVCVRSHHLVQGSFLADTFASLGLEYDCNPFIPAAANIKLRPWRFRNGLLAVPFMWSDYLHCAYDWNWEVEPYLKAQGLKVFAFHPIHLALNTKDLAVYHENKAQVSGMDSARDLRCPDENGGAHGFLRLLVGAAKQAALPTRRISDITISAVDQQ